MIHYPLSFQAQVSSASGIQTKWLSTSQGQNLCCSIPSQFEGPGGEFSAEDLFAQSLANCFVSTFKVYAEKSRVVFGQIEVTADLTVDLGDEKKPVMKSCLLSVNISGVQNPERVEMLAKKAFESGFILNSVKTRLEFNLLIS